MQGIATISAYRRPFGYQQITVTTVIGFTLPTLINGQPVGYAVIQCNGGVVRWRDDGVAPTATVGMSLPSGAELDYSGEMTALVFILSSGTPILDITYYN